MSMTEAQYIEAKQEIAEFECKYNGHSSWTPILEFGSAYPVAFICDRCGIAIGILTPEEMDQRRAEETKVREGEKKPD